MRTLAPDVHQLSGFAPHAINSYLVAGVLVDAGTPLARRRILRQLREHDVTAHVVTHGHPDHFGSSHAVCEALGIPLWTGEQDAQAVETASPVPGPRLVPGLAARIKVWCGGTRSAVVCAKATRLPASPCSTCRATHLATSPSGASPTASCSAGTSSSTCGEPVPRRTFSRSIRSEIVSRCADSPHCDRHWSCSATDLRCATRIASHEPSDDPDRANA